jgi:hypothetical protein
MFEKMARHQQLILHLERSLSFGRTDVLVADAARVLSIALDGDLRQLPELGYSRLDLDILLTAMFKPIRSVPTYKVYPDLFKALTSSRAFKSNLAKIRNLASYEEATMLMPSDLRIRFEASLIFFLQTWMVSSQIVEDEPGPLKTTTTAFATFNILLSGFAIDHPDLAADLQLNIIKILAETPREKVTMADIINHMDSESFRPTLRKLNKQLNSRFGNRISELVFKVSLLTPIAYLFIKLDANLVFRLNSWMDKIFDLQAQPDQMMIGLTHWLNAIFPTSSWTAVGVYGVGFVILALAENFSSQSVMARVAANRAAGQALNKNCTAYLMSEAL